MSQVEAKAAGADHDYVARLHSRSRYDEADPDPWLALHLDAGLPFDAQAKAALILDARSFSRRFVLPFVRPIARTWLVFAGLLRLLFPRFLSSSRLLHWLIERGLHWFVSPEANFLILRHFHLGSQVLTFLAANAPVKIPTHPIQPLCLLDVRDHIFLRHDLNLYNFVIRLNTHLAQAGTTLHPAEKLDFDPIQGAPIPFARFPRRFFNFLDLFSAIELYTPIYRLLLTERDFSRANHSLQLDETVGIYVAQVLGDATHLALVNNRHPLAPLSPLRAGFRLVIHGLATEILHAALVRHKAAQTSVGPRAGDGQRGLFASAVAAPSQVSTSSQVSNASRVEVGSPPLVGIGSGKPS
jgi:hypothetical protein